MAEHRTVDAEPTAVDDVRRVRERLDRESGGDLRKHVAETNRIFEQLRSKLHIKTTCTPETPPRRSGTDG